jgi:hypothetical protein
MSDWEFKIMLRGLDAAGLGVRRQQNVAVQLAPGGDEGEIDAVKIRDYIDRYFFMRSFQVWWGTVDGFVSELQQRWNAWRS